MYRLESIIFEKDYSVDTQEKPEMPEILTKLKETGFFSFYGTLMQQIPKEIIEKDKETYERVLQSCDLYAQRMHGKVYGIVDYEKWESHIYLTVPFLELVDDEDREIWKDIVENVGTICVETTEDGKVRIRILIDYFREVIDPDISDEELRNILVKAMQATGKDLDPDDERWNEIIADFRATIVDV